MISNKSLFLSQQLLRRMQPTLGVLTCREFTSPAFRRYQKKQSTKHAPTIASAQAMPTSLREMDNNVLICVAAMENHMARIEVLKRNIMAVDCVSYEDATRTFELIAIKNREALWFNEGYVTTDVPEPRDLETALEVGSWTWNWMEPPLGTLSFALLCLQFSRAQIQNLGIKPYTDWMREKHAKKLSAAFPKYNSEIIEQFSQTDPMIKW